MVSMVGYAVSEYVLFMTMTFALMFMLVLAALVKNVLEGESYSRTFIGGGVAAVLLLVIYWFDVRIGTIMFLNGIIVAILVQQLFAAYELRAGNQLL